jgi:hypothetical protein
VLVVKPVVPKGSGDGHGWPLLCWLCRRMKDLSHIIGDVDLADNNIF